MTCPTTARLADYLAESLPPEVASVIEAHIEHCTICQSVLDELTRRADIAWQLPDLTIPRIPRKSKFKLPGYVIDGEPKRGGQAVVYRARDEKLQRTVALKVLKFGEHSTNAEGTRLLDEARIIAGLKHPNIVQVFALVESENLPVVVMEWAEGGSLASRLDGTPLDADESAKLIASLARAVALAHKSGVLHRDIKPGNVLLPGDDLSVPKLADFGLAKLRGEAGEWSATTGLMGTPAYMAPEQASGERSARIGPQVDVYSLGAMLYELLTGRPPFRGASSFETLVLMRELEPIRPRQLRPGLNRDLETVCLKCLEKSPNSRYASADDLADDLERFLRNEPVKARPVGIIRRSVRWCRRYPVIGGLFITLALFVVLSLTNFPALWRRAEARTKDMREALKLYTSTANTVFKDARLLNSDHRDALLRAIELYRGALESAGDDPEELHDVAYAMLQLSEALMQVNELKSAESIGRRGVDTLRQLADQYPKRGRWRIDASDGCSSIHGIYKALGQREEAFEFQQEAVHRGEALSVDFPENDHVATVLTFYRDSLASSLRERGNLDEAIRIQGLALESARRLVRKYGHDPDKVVMYSRVVWNSARMLLARGDGDGFVRVSSEHIDWCDEMRANNLDWHKILPDSMMHVRLAAILDRLGRHDEATEMLARGLKLHRELAFRPGADRVKRYQFIGCLFAIAARLWSDSPMRASEMFQEVFDLCRELEQSPNPTDWTLVAMLYSRCPDIRFRDFDRAVELCRKAVREGEHLRLWLVHCLYLAGKYDEAQLEIDRHFKVRQSDSDALRHPESEIFRVLLLWRTGEHERARIEFRNLSPVVLDSVSPDDFVHELYNEAKALVDPATRAP